MKNGISKTGFKLVLIYLALVLLSVLFLVMSVESNPFSALYLIFLTIPWSQMLAIVLLSHGTIVELSTLYEIIIFSLFVIANCIIFYFFGSKHDKAKKRTP